VTHSANAFGHFQEVHLLVLRAGDALQFEKIHNGVCERAQLVQAVLVGRLGVAGCR
jgi:hypothetical protein